MKTTQKRFITIVAGLVMPIASSAGVTIGVNNLSVVQKSSSGVTIAFPDVCKTPSPAGPIPIPYPNIAMSSDATKGSKQEKVTAQEESADGARQPGLSSTGIARVNPDVLYSLDVKTEGKLNIRQTAGRDSVTTATYVDGKGNTLRLREHALIKLANGDLCAICVSKDGRVTAVYRLLPDRRK